MIVFDNHSRVNSVLTGHAGIRSRYRFAVHSQPPAGTLTQLADRSDMDRILLLHSEREARLLYGDSLAERIREGGRIIMTGGPLQGPHPWSLGAAQCIGEEPFALFILGGGGDHPGKADTLQIARMASQTAPWLRARYGLATVFVGGPHFAYAPALAWTITYYRTASNIQEFIGRARLVIIRPGYNVFREAYKAAARLIGLRTHQYLEASEEQLAILSGRLGAEVCELTAAALQEGVTRVMNGPCPPEPSCPWEDGLPAAVSAIRACRNDEHSMEWLGGNLRRRTCPKWLTVRIDDIFALTESVRWLLEVLTSRRISASLEVVPAALSFNGEQLDLWDPAGVFLEVSQHGYCHMPVPDSSGRGTTSEFDLMATQASEEESAALAAGYRALDSAFGIRFRGGFSAPYDALPGWLPKAWMSLGGKYLSVIWARVSGDLPTYRVAADVWDWRNRRHRSAAAVAADLVQGLDARQELGLVLHAECFHGRPARNWLLDLVDAVVDGGAVSVPLSLRALHPADRMA